MVSHMVDRARPLLSSSYHMGTPAFAADLLGLYHSLDHQRSKLSVAPQAQEDVTVATEASKLPPPRRHTLS